MNKDIETLKNILLSLEDTENGAIISLKQEEIDGLKSLSNLIEKQQKEIKGYILQQTQSNTHFEADKRVLELSKRGLMDYFDVKDVIITK